MNIKNLNFADWCIFILLLICFVAIVDVFLVLFAPIWGLRIFCGIVVTSILAAISIFIAEKVFHQNPDYFF